MNDIPGGRFESRHRQAKPARPERPQSWLGPLSAKQRKPSKPPEAKTAVNAQVAVEQAKLPSPRLAEGGGKPAPLPQTRRALQRWGGTACCVRVSGRECVAPAQFAVTRDISAPSCRQSARPGAWHAACTCDNRLACLVTQDQFPAARYQAHIGCAPLQPHSRLLYSCGTPWRLRAGVTTRQHLDRCCTSVTCTQPAMAFHHGPHNGQPMPTHAYAPFHLQQHPSPVIGAFPPQGTGAGHRIMPPQPLQDPGALGRGSQLHHPTLMMNHILPPPDTKCPVGTVVASAGGVRAKSARKRKPGSKRWSKAEVGS